MGAINETRRAELEEAYERLGGNVAAMARELDVARSTIYYYLDALGLRDKPLAGGQVRATKVEALDLPKRGVRRYILTCAQNNTHVHTPVWENLQALAKHYKAKLFCASYTYNQNAYGALSVKRGTKKRSEPDLWYDDEIQGLLDESDINMELAPGLVWCGRMNTLPTASSPLRGFETHTGRKSGILPHAKLAAESVASGKHEATKFNYTTGTITQRNYIQKRAGLRAEMLHSYGGLLVEVKPDGSWFVRQLCADGRNRIQDLDVVAEGGAVTTGNRVEAITWGDVHGAQVDPDVRRMAWGDGGMLDVLRPKRQFLHDLINFRPRNHHDRIDPHRMFKRYVEGEDGVEDELKECAALLHEIDRDWCKLVVVDSNHDNALERWLRETDYRFDPRNALFFLRTQLAKYEALAAGDEDFHTLEHALRRLACPKAAQFLREDESFITCRGSRDGIENGMHGHLGPNGSRGTPGGFARMGRRANTCDTHSAGIKDGIFTGGTSSLLDLEYNSGPSSWSHTHILTYPGATRALCTMWLDDWRA